MSARLRRMAARLWPDSLFGRLAIILFSGLVAAHVLAFVLIVLDRYAIEDELADDRFVVHAGDEDIHMAIERRLTDIVGLDVRLDIADSLAAVFGTRFAAPELMRMMVREGRLGRKSGSGFYDWKAV